MVEQGYKKEKIKDVSNQQFGKMSARFSNRTKPKNIGKTIVRLLKHSKSEVKVFGLVVFIVLVKTGLLLYAPHQIGNIIDRYTIGAYEGIEKEIGLLMVAYIIISLSGWFSEFCVAGASQRIIKDMREGLFDKLSRLPIQYFDEHSHGDIMSRFTNDIDSVSQVFSQSTTSLIRSGITVIGSIIIMLWLNVWLALGVLASVPLVFGLSKMIASKTINYYQMQAKYMGKVNGKVEETVYGLNIVQTFNQQPNFKENFEETNDLLYEYGRKAQLWTGLLMPLLNVINNLSFAVVGLIGGYLVIKGQTTVGVVASFIVYSRQFIRPLNELASIYNSLMSAIAGAQRVFDLLDEVEEKELDGVLKDFTLKGEVKFEDVGFSYIEGEEVIRKLSLDIKQGMKVAIVGPTGAGKTTIVNLITRFYSPQKGEITIDGYDISMLHRYDLLSQIGFVLQDTYLFGGTIYDNIKYGKLEASKEEIMEASSLAKAHDFIMKLPHQYDTVLTYGGMNLSQGERQLITIARAILLNPAMMILDEATSSVDILTEKTISNSMLKLMEGKTSFIIAHRLSTIVSADLILVLNNGRLVQHGNHESLMETQGFYRSMYDIQRI